jgi:hypothetical protein
MKRRLRDKRQADRVKAVIALSKGWSAAQAAEILLFDERKNYLPELQMLLTENFHIQAA